MELSYFDLERPEFEKKRILFGERYKDDCFSASTKKLILLLWQIKFGKKLPEGNQTNFCNDFLLPGLSNLSTLGAVDRDGIFQVFAVFDDPTDGHSPQTGNIGNGDPFRLEKLFFRLLEVFVQHL